MLPRPPQARDGVIADRGSPYGDRGFTIAGSGSSGPWCGCCGRNRPAAGAWGGGNDVIAATMPPGAHDCGNHVVARVTADGSGGNGEEGGAGGPGEVLTLTPRGHPPLTRHPG